MSSPIFTIGTGKRYQYAQDANGFWWVRSSIDGRWRAWVTTGSKNRPANIWYNPKLGQANLPTYKKDVTK